MFNLVAQLPRTSVWPVFWLAGFTLAVVLSAPVIAWATIGLSCVYGMVWAVELSLGPHRRSLRDASAAIFIAALVGFLVSVVFVVPELIAM